jgi:hypothetical protein
MQYKTTLIALLYTLVTLGTHVIAANLYTHVCVPLTWKGMLLNIFSVASPTCNFLLSMTAWTSNVYISSWAGIGFATLAFIQETFHTYRKRRETPV